ncbi:ADGRF3 isoform 2 [Pongo abelii]|uniref:ADGRF3 isoform 2 n=1 Tax=Pongo abelii TaxID=9601 RepID=A0A2J8VMM5_PONAB|nr:ADGRF3 isoform 2 [Pongo abelii]
MTTRKLSAHSAATPGYEAVTHKHHTGWARMRKTGLAEKPPPSTSQAFSALFWLFSAARWLTPRTLVTCRARAWLHSGSPSPSPSSRMETSPALRMPRCSPGMSPRLATWHRPHVPRAREA